MIDSPDDLHDFVLDLVGEIVTRSPSIETLIEWVEGEIRDGFEGGVDMDDQMRRHMACALARTAWNVTPQPLHGFRVMKIAEPGRNDRCVAGFNCKHKQCCGQMPRMPALDPEVGWVGVCEALPEDQLDGLIASGRVPDGMLHMVAQRMLEFNPERVRAMLEPRFAGPLGGLKEDAAQMMWVLADTYDALDKPRLKSKLLQRAIGEGRGVLRADALQRMATMLADKRDFKGAWEHFALAQRENPDDPSLSHLEVILLTDQERYDEAAERAKFWLAKLKRQGWVDDGDPMMELLREAAAGRAGTAIAAVSARAAGEEVTRFVNAVRRALDTPVVPGRVRAVSLADMAVDGGTGPGGTEEGADSSGGILQSVIKQLKGMGLDDASARREAEKVRPALEDQFKALQACADKAPAQTSLDLDDTDGSTDPDEYELAVDAPLAALEADWHRVWPVAKPMSTMPGPQADLDPWEPACADMWVQFIEQTTDAAQSPDVLDDWLAAMRFLDAGAQDWIARELVPRIEARAWEILSGAGLGDGELPWGVMQNRPLLRLLVTSAYDAQYAGDSASARTRMRDLLRINPNDNHAIRMALVNLDLAAGDNDAALAVIARYEDDGSPAVCYGAVLAWYRKQDMARAAAALRAARKACKKIESFLLPARKAKPKMSSYGIQYGGDDEAWLYREQMRAVWAATPGALDWLKRN